MHQLENIGVRLLRGVYDPKKKMLDISPASTLALLLPQWQVAACLVLTGQTLRLGGHSLELGMAHTVALRPTPTLYAHVVTTRNGNDEQRFDREIAHFRLETRLSPETISNCSREMHKSI